MYIYIYIYIYIRVYLSKSLSIYLSATGYSEPVTGTELDLDENAYGCASVALVRECTAIAAGSVTCRQSSSTHMQVCIDLYDRMRPRMHMHDGGDRGGEPESWKRPGDAQMGRSGHTRIRRRTPAKSDKLVCTGPDPYRVLFHGS